MALCGCGGNANSPVLENAPGGFTLSVLTEDVIGSHGTATLVERRELGETIVEVNLSNAEDLKALFFELSYDPQRFSPVIAEATGLLSSDNYSAGDADNELLEFTDLSTADMVTHGQVLAGFDDLSGFSGSGTVAVLRFAEGPAPGLRTASDDAPTKPIMQPVVEVSADLTRLSWKHDLRGDYNLDGLVFVNDMTVVGQFFGHAAPFEANPWAVLADGDGDGVVTVADLTPIGQNFNAAITNYEVFYTEDERRRPENSYVELAPIDSIKLVNVDAIVSDPGEVIVAHSVAAPNGWFFVCATNEGVRGPMSASVPAGQVEDTGNELPVPKFTAEAMASPNHLILLLDASESSDPDGVITKAQWDWDFDDNYWDWEDNGSLTKAWHAYDQRGFYTITLRLTDDTGAMAAYQQRVAVDIGSNLPPVAGFTVNMMETHTGHELEFNGWESVDPDGRIAMYRWDFDQDGEFDLESEYATAQHVYDHPGTYNVKLQVEDDLCFTHEAFREITIHQNQAPVVTVAELPREGKAPLDVTINPAGTFDPEDELQSVAYDFAGYTFSKFKSSWPGNPVELLESHQLTYYLKGSYPFSVIAEDEHGVKSEEWRWWFSVDGWETDSWQLAALPSECKSLDVADIDGRPGIALIGTTEAGSGIYFCKAADASGRDWLEPVLVKADKGLATMNCDLEMINGLPALAFYDVVDHQIFYVTAKDIDGREWNDPVGLGSGISHIAAYASLACINGNPAIAWCGGTAAWYRRAKDPQGQAWFDPVRLLDGYGSMDAVDMIEIESRAAICIARYWYGLHYVHMTDLNGVDFPEFNVIASTERWHSARLSLLASNGLPVCLAPTGVYKAQDFQGQSWQWVNRICPEDGMSSNLDICGIEFRGRLCSLAKTGDIFLTASKTRSGTEWHHPQMIDENLYYERDTLGAAVVGDKLFIVHRPYSQWENRDGRPYCRVIY